MAMNELISLVLEQIRGMWRFRWIALGLAWLVALVGWAYVYNLPSQYTTQARVHIDTQSAIAPLLSGLAVKPNTSRQIALLIKTVKSTPHLKTIARQSGLSLHADNAAEKQALIAKLNNRIKIHGSGRKTNLYRIKYTGQNPQTAHAVVQQTVNIMTSMVGSKDSNYTRAATQFLQGQVASYEQKMNEMEHRLSSFKKKHASLMPGTNDYVARLKSLQSSIGQLTIELDTARSRRRQLRRLASGSGGTTVPLEQSRQIQVLDKHIDQTRNQISQLLVRYTPKYPGVVDARNRLERLKQKRNETMARLRAHPDQRKPMTSASGSNWTQSAINKAGIQIQSLQSQIKRKKSKIQSLKQGADQMTDAQAKLAQMSRNYQATKMQYQKLLNRLYSARLSGQVQRQATPVDFRIVDPPDVPAQPSGPKRFALMVMALIAALAAGAGFAFVLSQLRPVFINRKSLAEVSGLPVLGSVSLAWTSAQRLRRRAMFAAFTLGTATLFVGFVAAVFFMPIAVRLVPTFMTGLPT